MKKNCKHFQQNKRLLSESNKNIKNKRTCPTNVEKALLLSRPAWGEWYIDTHSLSRKSVFSWRPAGSSNSRACVIPECIILVGPPGALSSSPPSLCWRMASISADNLQKKSTIYLNLHSGTKTFLRNNHLILEILYFGMKIFFVIWSWKSQLKSERDIVEKTIQQNKGFLFSLFFIHLKLELLTQFPASNDEKYFYLWKIDTT